jgi:hypothetical protein
VSSAQGRSPACLAATADLLKKFAELLDPEMRPPLREDGIWLVRPDGYVACSSHEVETIADYLDGLTRSKAP